MTKILSLVLLTLAAEGALALLHGLHMPTTVAMAVTIALHTLAHWVPTRRLTWGGFFVVVITMLGVHAMAHILDPDGRLMGIGLHLVAVIAIELVHRRTHLK